MNGKNAVAGYFNFTRKDRIGILILVVLIFLVFLLPSFLSGRSVPTIAADTSWVVAVRQLENKQKSHPRSSYDDGFVYQHDRPAGRMSPKMNLFEFDPNTLPAEGWKKLGLSARTVQTIQHYREKGGLFRKPEDLQHIYGLAPAQYEKLLPFVKIEKTAQQERPFADTRQAPVKSSRYAVIDINKADTSAFIALPGIGSKLAARIVSFRDKLGGFYSIQQVAEVYGLADSVYQKIRQYFTLENPLVKKIDINTATIEELKAHPYIRYTVASAILAYRHQHGPFLKTEDLRNIMAIPEEMYNKITPYVIIP